MPRLKGNGALDNRMASYGDAMVATAGLLSAMNLPQVTQGFWTEHSERAVILTGLSVLENPPTDKVFLGRWKPEGSDTYARSYGGRVARLQANLLQRQGILTTMKCLMSVRLLVVSRTG